MNTTKNSQPKSLLLNIIEKGLKIWFINQCNSIKSLSLDIFGTDLELIRGKIAEVNLSAEDLNFKDLLSKKVSLKTTEINFRFSKGKKIIKLKENFSIKGKVHISNTQLEEILMNNKWIWLLKLIQTKLLDSYKFKSLRAIDSLIQVKSLGGKDNIEKINRIIVNTIEGKINLKNLETNKEFIIPMEDSIYIKSVELESNDVILEGTANVIVT